MNEQEAAARRRRWISFGELIALAALIVSALGVWVSWKGSDHDKSTQTVERRSTVPLTLRAKAESGGQTLAISPVESAQAIQSLRIAIAGGSTIDVGSDGELSASDVQAALKGHENEAKGRRLEVPIRIEARYVEAGADRKANLSYRLQYRWRGGGLFGGRSVELLALAR